MAYEIKSARFVNADGSAVVINTEDRGDVVISERDRPDLWQKWTAWRNAGGSVAAYVPADFGKAPRRVEADLDSLKRAIIAKGVLTAAEVQAAEVEAEELLADARA